MRWVEEIPQSGEDDLKLADSVMMFYSNLLAFDHVRQQILIISNVILDDSSSQLEGKYSKAVADIEMLERMLSRPASSASLWTISR